VALFDLLADMPQCHTVATTGEKAASVIAEITGTPIPKMGECVRTDAGLEIWRMPSTSRAYPMRLELKADYYKRLFQSVGIV
jgi:G:T/U-mismatch repair DNA glycosylase